jgi:hypothetical protein
MWSDRNSGLEHENKELQMRFEALSVDMQNIQSTAQNLEMQVQSLQNEKED